MIRILFEDPPNNVLTTRQFTKGQSLRIGAQCPLYYVGSYAIIEVIPEHNEFSPIYGEVFIDINGNCWLDTIMPYVDSKATVRVSTSHWTGASVETVPISIGNVVPDENIIPFDWNAFLVKNGVVIAIVAVVALGGLYVATWLPKSTVKRSVLSRNNPRRRLT